MIRVMLVDDDPVTAKVVSFYLTQSGDKEVIWVKTAGEALYESRNPYDIILLDIMLPDVDGIELCNSLRRRLSCPIIFISCIDDEETIIRALSMGGDDFLCKPFNNRMLLARIDANLRRVKIEQQKRYQDRTQSNGLIIHADSRTIEKAGAIIVLTPIEFGILMYMIDRPNQVISASELYECVWGRSALDDLRTVVAHIHTLRSKLEDDRNSPRYIISVHGKGYYFAAGELQRR